MNMNASQSFNFLPIPTDIHFGCGILRTLPERIKSLGAKNAFLVTDPGVCAAGIMDRVSAILREASVDFTVCDRVKPDSGSRLIDETTVELKSSGADVVVGIGGGSSLDTAKAVAALATNAGSALDYAGLNKVRNRPLPMIAVPTTSGTGSEVTLWSVFTDDTRAVKVAIGGVLIYPSVALCDPELTLELPAALTAATGMDALAHAVECYTNNNCQPISGALAIEAIRLIGQHLRSAVLNGREPPVALWDDVGLDHGGYCHEPDSAGAGSRPGDAARKLGFAGSARRRAGGDFAVRDGIQLCCRAGEIRGCGTRTR